MQYIQLNENFRYFRLILCYSVSVILIIIQYLSNMAICRMSYYSLATLFDNTFKPMFMVDVQKK